MIPDEAEKGIHDMKIQLRLLNDDIEDYQLLQRWFEDPEVARFYSSHPNTIEDIQLKYRQRIISARE